MTYTQEEVDRLMKAVEKDMNWSVHAALFTGMGLGLVAGGFLGVLFTVGVIRGIGM